MKGSSNFYLEQKVWRRLGASTLILYRCLKDISTSKVAVQSADFFRVPIDYEQLLVSEKQFFELLVEIGPADRCDWFENIAEAILAHERDFS